MGGCRRAIGKADYQARFANLLKLPEGANSGAAINAAMKDIEVENEDLGQTRDLLLPRLVGER